jgi:hypothetical protein
MTERKILVAKSYEGLPFVSEPYVLNGKEYVKVRMKNGSIKQVRSYSPSEYAKYNPEVKIIKPAKSRRDVLGFGEKGYIWIFKGATPGATYENLDFFRASPCRYTRVWGWYLGSDETMPEPLPANIEPIKLEWADVSFDGQLISEDSIKQIVDSLIYEPGTSKHIGKVGDRIEFDGVLTKMIINQGAYGVSYYYIFNGDDGNIYTWNTASRTLDEGQRYHVRGSLKEHTTYRAVAQNVLTRCKVEEI